jgi:hypothetical protein
MQRGKFDAAVVVKMQYGGSYTTIRLESKFLGCPGKNFMSRPFWVADLDTQGEIKLKEEYDYDALQMIDLAAILIAEFATYLWSDPAGFEIGIPGAPTMSLRWRPSADSAGIASLRYSGRLSSLILVASGKDRQTDALTLQAFQTHLVQELHDTKYEPAFDLMGIPERPLAASIHFASPEEGMERAVFALADRCFAAAYFRYQGLV